MEKFRPFWHRTPKKVRQALVLFVGLLVICLGLVLVPLPGPGWLIVFIGLAILASEFEFADRWKKFIETRVKQAAESAKNKSKRLRKK